MSARGVRRFVEDMLRGRATKPFHAEEADVAELRAAIALRTARAGSGAPSEEFLGGLHRRLAAELDVAQADPTSTPAFGGSRRRFILGASIAASAAAIGAVTEYTVAATREQHPPSDTAQGEATLSPTTGVWRTVAAGDELPDGAVRAFDLGSVSGFVHRGGSGLRAVSGTCTHQGCQLRLNAPARRLDCPCHNAAFAVTGEVLFSQLAVAPPALPLLTVREVQGAIQVYAPPAAG